MPDVLVFGDTFRSPELRHEITLGIPDPFLYAEVGGARHVVVGSLEIPRLEALGLDGLHPYEEYGSDDLIAEGRSYLEVRRKIPVRAVKRLGVTAAVVPPTFPVWLADRLRAEGVELTVDDEQFAERRRVKTTAELEGIRRAQRAAEAGMDAARDLLRRSEPAGESLVTGGEPLTVEQIKSAMAGAFAAAGTSADEFIVAPGAQGAVGHDMGSGPVRPGVPIVIDVWPRDAETACYADMTRTFVVGDVPDEVARWHGLCKQALDAAAAAIHDGAPARGVYDVTCDIFEAAGEPTQRTKEPGRTLAEGFFHGLGHGVGLEVHERPAMGLASRDTLRAGDVVTVEPGLYRQGFGGVRLEDLLLVTGSGSESLTRYPYDLAP